MLPAKGLIKLLTIINKEKAPAPTERLQPNSFNRATKKTEKAYQIPKTRAKVMKLAPTITQPKWIVFSFFIRERFPLR
jgi:hypothetical protein